MNTITVEVPGWRWRWNAAERIVELYEVSTGTVVSTVTEAKAQEIERRSKGDRQRAVVELSAMLMSRADV